MSETAFVATISQCIQHLLQLHVALLRCWTWNAVQHAARLIKVEQWRSGLGKCFESCFNDFFTIIWTNNKL
jgi:hypothetical protein